MSFIASLAAVGTAVGVSGAVAAPLAGAGILAAGGAALGAGTSAAMGGDPGKGALMGAVTAPFMAPLMPTASAGTAVAQNVGANAAQNVGANAAQNVGANAAQNVGANAAQNVGANAAQNVGANAAQNVGANAAQNVGANVAKDVGTQAVEQTGAQGVEQLAQKAAYDMADEQLLYAGANRAATDAAIKAGATDAIQTALPEATWGQNAIANTFNIGSRSLGAKIGGGALENAVYGAGIGALGSGVTGQDPLKGAATGMVAGGIGGAGQAGLASKAGATGFLGKAGQFAAEHPVITSGGIGMLAQPMLNGMMSGSETPSPTEQKSQFAWGGPKYAYSPSSYRPYDITQHRDMFPIYQPSYYAAGGLTDVDGYMSQAQNVNQGMSKGGPSDMGIPNPNEVADPEGYASNSVQMMARGGVARYGIGGDISKVADLAVSTSLPGQIFGWESASELPIVGGLFNDPSRTASLTPEEKKKLMAAAAARNQTVPVQADNNPPQQMARGGIASLGAYSKGGNLLDGPGDGVSDDIPASIENKQPARLARGEYVIPSRIVSELGNGSTDAGAARLDEMVKRIQTGRKKTLKGKDYAKDTKAYKHLPV